MAGGRKAVVFLALCILICCVGGCQNDRKDVEVKVCKTSIFSWEEEYMLPGAEEEVQKAMECWIVRPYTSRFRQIRIWM